MEFLVISDAPSLLQNNKYCAYAPYVREMDIWFKHAKNIKIISPTKYNNKLLLAPFKEQPQVVSVGAINFNSFKNILNSIFSLPFVIFTLITYIKKADHIHLRCPGNIALVGCVIQIFFPKKIKTVKYAGNWDPKAKQPVSYKFQKWILSNTFLTKNITVLVYGNWENQTKNIKSFFTATYSNNERKVIEPRNYSGPLKFVFIGSLVEGKRPLFAIQIIEKLIEIGFNVTLALYGEGKMKPSLQNYIKENNLNSRIKLFGNQEKEVIKQALHEVHFLILPSKSEGWPKAIAEAMFFGVIPISTSVSCVPYMLDYGNRGVLIAPQLSKAMDSISQVLSDVELLNAMSIEAVRWSQKFTIEVFEDEIVKLLEV